MSIERNPEKPAGERIREIYKGVVPDAVVVLSADIVEAPERVSGYKSGSYEDVDVRDLLSGAKARVIAGVETAKHFTETVIVTDSRDRDPSRGRPTHAQIYAQELERFGVPPKRIVQEIESVNTVTELVETIKMAVERGWKNVALISNDYHLPRIQEMYNRLGTLADQNDEDFTKAFAKFQASNGTITLVSAEDILLVRSPRYKKLIDEVHELPSYEARVVAEEQGIRDLRADGYKVA